MNRTGARASTTTHSRGTFVVLEGIDGSGTTTQAKRLVDAATARGQRAHFTCDPSSGPIGKDIRARLSSTPPSGEGWATLALLFAADRVDHIANEIVPALAAGDLVICDRYVLSSLVYQGIHLDTDWVAEINRRAQLPDLTVLLDVDPDAAAQRREVRGGVEEIYDADDTQRMLAERYRKLAPRVGATIIDGNRSIDDVANDLLARVRGVSAFVEDGGDDRGLSE